MTTPRLIMTLLFSMFVITAAAGAYDANVSRAQERLQELGYAPGPIDGLLGAKTNKAIEQFQRDAGLPVTGRLDDVTKEKLHLKSANQDVPADYSSMSIGDMSHLVHKAGKSQAMDLIPKLESRIVGELRNHKLDHFSIKVDKDVLDNIGEEIERLMAKSAASPKQSAGAGIHEEAGTIIMKHWMERPELFVLVLQPGTMTFTDGTIISPEKIIIYSQSEFPGDTGGELGQEDGSIYRFVGTSQLGEYTFVGEGGWRNRLTFTKMDEESGIQFTYVRGKGSVALPDGTVMEF